MLSTVCFEPQNGGDGERKHDQTIWKRGVRYQRLARHTELGGRREHGLPADGLTVDLQHGLVDYQAAVTMMQAIATGMPTMCRGWLEPGIIMKLPDAGAWGIVCPMINTRDECERFVGACRYPPRGYRSFGPAGAAVLRPRLLKNINDSVIQWR